MKPGASNLFPAERRVCASSESEELEAYAFSIQTVDLRVKVLLLRRFRKELQTTLQRFVQTGNSSTTQARRNKPS